MKAKNGIDEVHAMRKVINPLKSWSVVGFLVGGMLFSQAGDLDQTYRAAIDKKGRTEADLARDKHSKPIEILKFTRIKPGMVIADIFAGGGYYSEILANVVGPEGKVYLHNNQAYLQFVAKQLDERLAGDRLANVVNHKREADALELPDNSLDRVFMVMSYHDIYFETQGWKLDGTRLFDQIKKALKPGGLLVIIDHAAEAGSRQTQVQKLHRIDEAFAKKDISSHGFILVGEGMALRNSEDDHAVNVFDPKVKGKTDKFVLLFKKTG